MVDRTAAWGGLARQHARMEAQHGRPLEVGMVVSAAVRNLREQERGAYEREKYRPVVVLALSPGDAILALGLTSKSTYQTTGEARPMLPDWELVPLRTQAFVFSWRPVFIPRDDVRGIIGRVTPRAAAFLAEHVLDDGQRVDRVALLGGA